MRLNQHQKQAILTTTKLVFAKNAQVWIFGSRLDDLKHGGDIDLLISTQTGDEIAQIAKFKHALYKIIGEQKIDVQILRDPPTEFQQLVLESAVLL